MNTQYQKVAVVTGASQGLGASIVDAYRKLGYAVVATSRTITPSGDPGILTVQGDIADPATAERVIAAGGAEVGRIDTLVKNAGLFVAQAVHRLHAGRLRRHDRSEPGGLLPH